MNSMRISQLTRLALALLSTLFLAWVGSSPVDGAQSPSPCDEDWERLMLLSEDLPEGKAIRGRRVQGAERLRLRAVLHSREWAAADLSARFRSACPDHPKAPAALKNELEQMIWAAEIATSVDSNLFDRVERLVAEFMADTRFTERERFSMSSAALGRVTYARFNGLTNALDLPALLDHELRDARLLRKAFPNNAELWEQFQLIAGQMAPDRARPVLEEILQYAPLGRARAKAEGLYWRLEAKGKPFRLSFTAIDGRSIDTSEWRGKVILIDFWATWCGPCVAELPTLRRTYEEFHRRGFEVVGISLDTDKAALERFQTRSPVPWPLHFDGRGWNSDIVIRYGVSLIPSLWLIDKRGLIRHLDAREDLAAKVKSLLDE